MAAAIFSLFTAVDMYAEESEEKICVVKVSKSDGKITFAAENGFVTSVQTESYLFTDSKYIRFEPSSEVSQGLVEYERSGGNVQKNIDFYGSDYRILSTNSFRYFVQFEYISCKGDVGSCKVAGRKLIIRKPVELDTLKVTISYKYGDEGQKKDSTACLDLPVDDEVIRNVYESASDFNFVVSKFPHQNRGRINRVIYVGAERKDTLELTDNYYETSFKPKPYDSKEFVSEVIVCSTVLDEDYKEVDKTLTIKLAKVAEPKEGWPKKLMAWLVNNIRYILVVLLAIFGVRAAYIFVKYLLKRTMKSQRPEEYESIEMTVGENYQIKEKPVMLSWRVRVIGRKGEKKELTPDKLYEEPYHFDSDDKKLKVEYDGKEFCEHSPADFSELRLERDKETQRLVLRAIYRGGGMLTLQTPNTKYRFRKNGVVRVRKEDNVFIATSAGVTDVLTENNRYSWKIEVRSNKGQKNEPADSSAVDMHLEQPVQNQTKLEQMHPAHAADDSAKIENARLALLQKFFDQTMEAVKIEPKKILNADAGTVDAEIKDVIERIRKDRSMYEMVDEQFSAYYQQNTKKEDCYRGVISKLIAYKGYLAAIMREYGQNNPVMTVEAVKDDTNFIKGITGTLGCGRDRVMLELSSLNSKAEELLALTKCISDNLHFDGITMPENIIVKASECVKGYDDIKQAKDAAERMCRELEATLEQTSKDLEEMKKKYASADDVHKSNRSFYLTNLCTVLDVLDASLKKISSNVLSSSECAAMVKGIYTSANGFKAFHDFVRNEDWSNKDELKDICATLESRLNSAIVYERSWVNGIARFHAYLRVPQLEAHLAGAGLSKRDFEIAYNAMNVLYTAFFDYKRLILPMLFVDTYNPDVHDYNEQAVGNVISAVCSVYDSFRDSRSKLCDLNKLGFEKADSTTVKPEVIF